MPWEIHKLLCPVGVFEAAMRGLALDKSGLAACSAVQAHEENAAEWAKVRDVVHSRHFQELASVQRYWSGEAEDNPILSWWREFKRAKVAFRQEGQKGQ